MYIIELINILKKNFGQVLSGGSSITSTSLSFVVKKEYLNYMLFFLKNSSFFSCRSLSDIFGVDCLVKSYSKHRFLVYYILYSKRYGVTLSVRVFLDTYDIIASSTNHFNSAAWLEREIYDMYGIFFYKNADMRRILTDYGFEGFPLRKDFPLIGFFELQYSEEEKVVISQPIKVGQVLRLFHYSSVWNLVKK